MQALAERSGQANVMRTSPAFMLNRKRVDVDGKEAHRLNKSLSFNGKENAVMSQGSRVETQASVEALDQLHTTALQDGWAEESQANLQKLSALVSTGKACAAEMQSQVERESRQLAAKQAQQVKLATRVVEKEKAAMKELPPWKADDEQQECFHCTEAFGVFRRRSHCRACGNLFHRNCANTFVPLPKLGYTDPVRVCPTCHRDVLAEQAKEEAERVRKAEANKPAPFHMKLLAQVKSASAKDLSSGRRSQHLAPRTPVRTPSRGGDNKPMSVLDELRNSLKKRNSTPELLRHSESVGDLIDKQLEEKRRLNSGLSSSVQFFVPRPDTPIATLLDRAAESEDGSTGAQAQEDVVRQRGERVRLGVHGGGALEVAAELVERAVELLQARVERRGLVHGGGGWRSAAKKSGAHKNPYIEQFLLLAKGNSGKAAAALVEKVLNHKHIFVFGEILELENVAKLRGTDDEGWLRALEIFAFGTYQEYVGKQASLPPLSEAQAHKLRQLTLVSLASSKKDKVLGYDDLLQALGLETARELEDLIIESIFSKLVQGKLNPGRRQFEVESVMGRDVRDQDIDSMLATLGGWCDRAESVMGRLEELFKEVRQTQSADQQSRDNVETKIRSMFASGGAESGRGSGRRSAKYRGGGGGGNNNNH
ncbi:COP9 signalosome complex subunit 7b (SGN7b) (Signalosome subunit 7b) (JAB1-containing signalosome subunit 7b) [Durusdinium trenchii]|uniref:COP9 signalosome complex subunit 7b (SGN7b) (Signalosome subunit 7b) (JAB1-containing signalosome subunit 7b) n=1 Tax=Durusdinium trenchii TaxID=1381693 RepID=A0ABP0RXU9_9DINO